MPGITHTPTRPSSGTAAASALPPSISPSDKLLRWQTRVEANDVNAHVKEMERQKKLLFGAEVIIGLMGDVADDR